MTEVHLRVNDELTVYRLDSRPLKLSAGDRVHVERVGFTNDASGTGLDGLIALEGYVFKLDAFTGESLLDYDDGRFSTAIAASALAAGSASPGLDGDWEFRSDMDRLVVVAVRYGSEATVVADRFFVRFHITQPDSVGAAGAGNEPQQTRVTAKVSWDRTKVTSERADRMHAMDQPGMGVAGVHETP